MHPLSTRRDGVHPALMVLAIMLALVPIITANLTSLGIGPLPLLYDAIELPRFALSLIGSLLAAWLWAIEMRRNGGSVRVSPTLGLLIALAGIALISTLTSIDPYLSALGQSERLEGFVTYGVQALLFALGLNVVRGIRDLRALAAGLTVAAGLSAAYGLAQAAGFDPASYLISNPLFDVRRSFATFGNPNFLAGFLVLALPVVAGLAAQSRSARIAAVLWVVAAAVAGALLLSFTRSAWLALGIQGVLTLAALTTKRIRLEPFARWALLAVVAVVVLLGLVSIGRGGEVDVAQRLRDVGQSSSFNERVLGWEAATQAAAERPILGYGPGMFLPAFRLHRPEAYATAFGAESMINNAHNWPLQVAATLGIPAAIVLVASIGLALWSSGRIVWGKRARESNDSSASGGVLYAGVWLGCVGYLAHMMLSVAVHGATTPFWVLLGALAAPSARAIATDSWRSSVRVGVVAVATIMLGIAVAGSMVLMSADASYLHARTVYRGVATGDAAASASRAVQLNPFSVKYARGQAEVIADTYYTQRVAGSTDLIESFEAGDAAYASVRERYPNDYAATAWHAALLASAADAGVADGLGERALSVAARAAELDRQAQRVQPILEGHTDSGAVNAALAALGLP